MTDQTHSKPADPTAKPSASPDAPSHADRGTLELGLDKVEPLSPPPGWLDRCAQAGIVLENDEPSRLGHFLAMLMHANTRMNLTAVRDEQEAWDRHIFDALTLIPMLSELEPNAKVIDIGTGGGIPGVPLAIVMPTLRFTLMDATKKKCDYLYEAVTALGMDNARVICARAEALGQDRGERTATGRIGAHRDHYDLAMARGVGQIAMLAELTIPLVKIGGLVLMTKGQRAEEELAEAKQALHMLHAAHAGTIDTPTGKVVVLEKMRTTPRDYPRRDGEPKRSPLGISKK